MALTFTINPFVGGVSIAQQALWDADLRSAANYLYRLCNYYVFEASGIVANNSGQVIYNPTTGQVLNGFIPVDYQFIVGSIDNPMDITNTYFTITDQRIFAGSLNIHVDEGEKPVDLNNQVSYDPIYSPNSIRVTFNQPLVDGQVVRYGYFKGLATANGTKTSQEPIYYTFTSDETSISFSELVGVPLVDLRVVLRSGSGVRPVLGATADSTQLQYDNGVAGTFTPPTGDTFISGSNLTIEYVA